MSAWLEIRGESYLTLEAAAGCYRVERAWIAEVYAHGLLGPGQGVDGSIAVPARELDRLAAALRWNRHHGLALCALAAWIE